MTWEDAKEKAVAGAVGMAIGAFGFTGLTVFKDSERVTRLEERQQAVIQTQRKTVETLDAMRQENKADHQRLEDLIRESRSGQD